MTDKQFAIEFDRFVCAHHRFDVSRIGSARGEAAAATMDRIFSRMECGNREREFLAAFENYLRYKNNRSGGKRKIFEF